ncbi:hypothetical protein [Candidatus Avelusimicrobium luingense]|uniref:hypothetical protein n=1 Tax=Candidatus Avelusimicrobium luingense TaxID=3416211 RepID=UPI003D0CBE01
MKRIIVVFLLTAVLGSTQLAAHHVTSAELKTELARAVAQETLKNSLNVYEVQATVSFEKKILLKDTMFRPARHPADSNQVLSVETAQKQCLGVLVSKGSQVVLPAVCLEQGNYQPTRIVMKFKQGNEVSVKADDLVIREDVAWVNVDAALTKQNPYVIFTRTEQGKTLQDKFGEPMSEHLKQFFRKRGVVERRRCRMGMVYSDSRLRVGEPVFYQGKLVALVKARTKTYGGLLGGVSESALAVIR